MTNSAIPNFYKKSRSERLAILKENTGLTDQEISVLESEGSGFAFGDADRMVENAIGTVSTPLGIATNFVIDGRDYLIPMAIEEPSVIAAASKGAKLARISGGFTTSVDEPRITGQIQVTGYDPDSLDKLNDAKSNILDIANKQSATLSRMNRGARDLSWRTIDTDTGKMLIVEILIDPGDAMGANITNTMCEAVSPVIADITGGDVLLRILSNYSTDRIARATAVFDADAIGGTDIVDNIILAYQFAAHDVYRAVTHNKGAMNGVIAVANATGQDSRAIEAAAGAYASRGGRYTSLTSWHKDSSGNLVGGIELPLSVGTVGGIIDVHPTVRICKKILGVSSSKELAGIMASAGLAQNFGAMYALSTDGIQKGHMRLHARNLAAAAGAKGSDIDDIAGRMIQEKAISLERARQLLSNDII